MKHVLLIFILLPTLAFGQKFDISGQGGVSTTTNLTRTEQTDNGPSFQLAVGYKVFKHLKINAFYQANLWSTTNNTFGISPEFVTRHFFAGLDFEEAFYATTSPRWYTTYHFNPSFGYGIHIGTMHKIYKRLYGLGQLGYSQHQVKGTYDTETGGAIGYHAPISETLNTFYLRLGLSMRM